MAQSTLWWLLAGAAVGVELMTGTFYLLMFAVGLAAAALAAHFGLAVTVQIVIAAFVGAGSVVAWHRYKQAQPAAAPANANRDVNLDIGATVQVETWQADGTATVKYRGANWTIAMADSTLALLAGPHRVVEVVGSRLIVARI
jgi:membrane protein implicated in regulation of membrane protease activity